MFHYHIHVRTGLFELIIMISIDNVPTLYQNKYNKSNRVNYLPTPFRYLESRVYRCEWNVNTFWITKNAFDFWVFLCLMSQAEFCGLALVDTWRSSQITKAHNHLINKLLERVGGVPTPLLITLPSLMVIGVVKLEKHFFANITWSHDRWVT